MSLQTHYTPNLQKITITSFKIRPRAIEKMEKGEKLTRHMSSTIYKKYIDSPEWQVMVKKYRKEYCELCGSNKYLALHHLSYQNLLRETDKDFATLCKYCHLANHINVVSLKRLRNPSNGTRKLIERIRCGKKIKPSAFQIFLRRRWIAKHGDKQIPEFEFFRKFYRTYIENKEYPFGYSLTAL